MKSIKTSTSSLSSGLLSDFIFSTGHTEDSPTILSMMNMSNTNETVSAHPPPKQKACCKSTVFMYDGDQSLIVE